MDTAKLIKLMNLTVSDNDGEALNAIRIANSLVKKNGLTWSQLLNAPAQQPKPKQEPPPPKQKTKVHFDQPSVDEMLDHCLDVCTTPSVVDFLESIADFYRKRGYLSVKQEAALTKIYWRSL